MSLDAPDDTTEIRVTLPCELAASIKKHYGGSSVSAAEAVRRAAADGVFCRENESDD